MAHEYSINTTLVRDEDEFDICIYFIVTSFLKGCPARIRYDENDHPAEPDEYEFEIIRAEFDGCGEDAAPISPTEFVALRGWFDNNYSRACDAVVEDYNR